MQSYSHSAHQWTFRTTESETAAVVFSCVDNFIYFSCRLVPVVLPVSCCECKGLNSHNITVKRSPAPRMEQGELKTYECTACTQGKLRQECVHTRKVTQSDHMWEERYDNQKNSQANQLLLAMIGTQLTEYRPVPLPVLVLASRQRSLSHSGA